MNMTIAEFAEASKSAPYDEKHKNTYLRMARRFLIQLGKELGLDPNDCDVRTNRAGIAVAGDVTLHHERIYITLGDCVGGMYGLVRSCQGRKDYTGGQNNPIMEHSTNEWLLKRCRELLQAAA